MSDITSDGTTPTEQPGRGARRPLALLDLMMPKMDGFDTLDRMRTDPRTQTVPVVILTSKVLNLDDIKRIE